MTKDCVGVERLLSVGQMRWRHGNERSPKWRYLDHFDTYPIVQGRMPRRSSLRSQAGQPRLSQCVDPHWPVRAQVLFGCLYSICTILRSDSPKSDVTKYEAGFEVVGSTQ